MTTSRGDIVGESSNTVRVALSEEPDTDRAVGELLDELHADSAELTFLFFSPEHDEEIVSRHLDRRAGSRAVAGTTAGELSPLGFTRGTMVGMSLRGSQVRAAIEVVPNLEGLSLVPLTQLPEQLARRVDRTCEELDPDRHVWILLPDGLSGSEDLLTPFFMQSAPDTNLIGGSLADGLRSERIHLVHHGRIYSDAAAVILLEYDRPFSLIHDNHMAFTDQWLEVTRVSEGGRLIEQLNDRPALEVYADALEQPVEAIDASFTASHPLGFRFRGRPFVCSILQYDESGFLMANAVHEGARLNILESNDLVESTRTVIEEAIESMRRDHARSPQGILAFHCLGRYLEAEREGRLPELAEALTRVPVAGLNTYGEQYRSMHTNHSLTGILFG